MEQQKSVIDENKVIQTIIIGSDWREVLSTLVAEEGMDPSLVDIIKLTEVFTEYLQRLKKFDFRIPARFILIAAILLRMKCELLLEEEEEKIRQETQQLPPIDISNIPPLSPPLIRKPVRHVTLDELVKALNNAFEFKERKEGKQIRMKKAIENLIEYEEDIEVRINRIHNQIIVNGTIMFSKLVPVWRPKEIVDAFMPVLYLYQRNFVDAEQEEMFADIKITVKKASSQ